MLTVIMTILGGFFKKLFGGDLTTVFITIMLALVAVIVIPNYSRIASFFGHDTKEVLKEKLQRSEANTATAVEANKSQERAVKILEGTVQNVEKTYEDKAAVVEKTTVTVAEIKETKKEKIRQIMDRPLPEPEKTKEISNVEIQSVWQAYCKFNVDSECAVNVTPS